MKSFLVAISILMLFYACGDQKNSNKTLQKLTRWQTATLIHDTLQVSIPVEGKLVAWKKVDITSPVKARLVSLLVEADDRVTRGDLILSLWPIDPGNNFSTIDIHAPLSGIVRAVYFTFKDTISAGQPIITIENRENLILQTSLSYGAFAFVKPNLNVALKYRNNIIKGAVWQVDKKLQQVTIVVPNQQLHLKQDIYVTGYIDLGRVSGSFLPVTFFDLTDSVKVRFGDKQITLQKVGSYKDSLTLVYPDLPTTAQVRVKKILTL